MIRNILLVALGGAFGAVCRYLTTLAIQERWIATFPLGTLVVNVVGCLVMGIVAQAHLAEAMPSAVRLLLVTGGLGALTTFSAFAYETIRCFQLHAPRVGTLNIAANVVLSLLAVLAGLAFGRLVWPCHRS
jgi:CrcB protein